MSKKSIKIILKKDSFEDSKNQHTLQSDLGGEDIPPSIDYGQYNTIVNHTTPVTRRGVLKKKRPKLSILEKQKNMFNKLYGLDESFNKTLRKIKRERVLTLQEHQNKLLQLSINLRKENLMKLNKELRNIRFESSSIQPLPPLNYRSLVEHSKNESKKAKKERKLRLSLQQSLNTQPEKDEFELEMEQANRIKYNRPIRENPNLTRMYEILPEHIVEVFAKKMK